MIDKFIKTIILVLHSNYKKESNTLMKVFYKHYGLNYFGPRYWKGIDYVQNYPMQMQYPY
jgi:hypothetical protein